MDRKRPPVYENVTVQVTIGAGFVPEWLRTEMARVVLNQLHGML